MPVNNLFVITIFTNVINVIFIGHLYKKMISMVKKDIMKQINSENRWTESVIFKH